MCDLTRCWRLYDPADLEIDAPALVLVIPKEQSPFSPDFTKVRGWFFVQSFIHEEYIVVVPVIPGHWYPTKFMRGRWTFRIIPKDGHAGDEQSWFFQADESSRNRF